MMWHGKSAMSRGMGYSHGRTTRRATKDSSVGMSNKAEATLGASALLGFVVFVALILMLIGVI
jgi:hypothetical protein